MLLTMLTLLTMLNMLTLLTLLITLTVLTLLTLLQVIDGMHITVSTLRLTVQLQHQYVTTELNGVELVSTNR